MARTASGSTKGAPQVVLSLARLTDCAVLKAAGDMVEALSLKGSRTLAVARSRSADGDDFELVGLLALADPPRPDAKQMIAEARGLGVKPIMVTGDNIAIARQIALELGIGGRVMRMGDLAAFPESEQMQVVQGCDVLAEVYPEDKYKVVKLLQAHGHVSGMTGDGVNDAPALKQAEVGIAVKGATNVAKASASMVLTEPGIRVIVDALKTSRQIYQRHAHVGHQQGHQDDPARRHPDPGLFLAARPRGLSPRYGAPRVRQRLRDHDAFNG